MQYAIVNSIRTEAFPNGKGICEVCNSQLLAKCGSRKINHWAHLSKKNCDPWWENETEWHRDWKSKFPEECREVIHRDANGEIHRADIKTNTGIIIEVQHSNISDTERLARELFYKNIIWIVDGKKFKDNFYIYHMLPNPNCDLAQDIVWAKAKVNLNGANAGLFFRLSENPDYSKINLNGGLIHSLSKIKAEVEFNYNGYHQYDWKKPRNTWLDSKCPVFIDFGGDYLVQLMIYDESLLKCIRYVSKRKLINYVSLEKNVYKIVSEL